MLALATIIYIMLGLMVLYFFSEYFYKIYNEPKSKIYLVIGITIAGILYFLSIFDGIYRVM